MFLTRFFSPHQLNPLDLNPLRATLEAQIDFERLRSDRGIKLFVAATQVTIGRPRLFSNEDLTLDTLLASACIPTLNHPVEIDGEAYWDGGLTANPPLRPLLYQCSARDLLVILLEPCRRPEIPTTADEITRRLTLLSRLNAHADFINALREEGRRRAGAWLRQNRRFVGARSSFVLSEHLG